MSLLKTQTEKRAQELSNDAADLPPNNPPDNPTRDADNKEPAHSFTSE